MIVQGFTPDAVRAAMQASFAAKEAVVFPAGDYDLGEHSAADVIFPLAQYGSDLTLISEGARFIINTTGSNPVMPIVFLMAGQSNIRFQGAWSFEDLGGSFYPSVTLYKGARAFVALPYTSGVSIDRIDTRNMMSAFSAIVDSSLPGGAMGTTSDINIGTMNIVGTMYGFNLQNQGSHSRVGQINAVNSGRSFFVYGCDDVQATVTQFDPQAGRTSIITHYGGLNTTNIKLTISDVRDWADAGMVVDISHANSLGQSAVLENIEVDITASFRNPAPNVQDGSYEFSMVAFNSFPLGGDATILTSDQVWRNITVNGTRGTSYPWLVRPSFTSLIPQGTLTMPASEPVNLRLPSEFVINGGVVPPIIQPPVTTKPPKKPHGKTSH